MPNMSYCRFRNTLSDLNDCFQHLFDDLSTEETLARSELVDLCRKIVDDYELEEEDDDG